MSAIVDDCYGLGHVTPDQPQHVARVEVVGTLHSGFGELVSVDSLGGSRYRLAYNIDGSSWVYAGTYDDAEHSFVVERTLCGAGELSDGVMQAIHFDRFTDQHVLSFSTATAPAQLHVVGPEGTTQLTDERVHGIPSEHLAVGEDASFESHDGLHIPARLFVPAEGLGFEGERPTCSGAGV